MRTGNSPGGLLSSTFDRIAAVCICMFFCGDAEANDTDDKTIGSAFDSRVVRLIAKPSDKAVAAEWTYTNLWDIPLLVERFDQSCGCLSGQMAPGGHEAVAPGKAGTIRAQFTPGKHRGLLRKSLHVRFVGYEKPVELIVEATIPSTVELSTRELLWKTDDTSISLQTIEVTSGTGADFAITGLLGVPDSRFTITSETLTENRHYRVSITPSGSLSPGIDTLQIRTNSSDPRDRVLPVFLRTEGPSPSPVNPSKPQPATGP